MSSDLKVTNIKHASSASNNLVLASDGSATINQISSSSVFPAGGTGNPISVAYLYEEQPNGTNGGDFSSGWQTRQLNTELDPDSIVSLSSYQFTLGAGTYLLMWSSSGYDVLDHKTAIYDITGTAYLNPSGSSELAQTGYNDMTRSMGSLIVTPTSNNIYELRHYANSSKTVSGFGYATGSGETEIYATVTILKLK